MVTKKNRDGVTFSVGDTVKVFGKKVAKVAKVAGNGKRVYVTGDYTGFTGVDNLKGVAV